MDGTLVFVSLVDTVATVIFGQKSKIFDILRVFRLVRALRPLRVINRAPGLKLVVQTLLSSLKVPKIVHSHHFYPFLMPRIMRGTSLEVKFIVPSMRNVIITVKSTSVCKCVQEEIKIICF